MGGLSEQGEPTPLCPGLSGQRMQDIEMGEILQRFGHYMRIVGHMLEDVGHLVEVLVEEILH